MNQKHIGFKNTNCNMGIKELEARENALQEEMEPRRNACLEASQKFNALMED